MDLALNETEPLPRVICLADVGVALASHPRTVERALKNYNIPLTVIGPKSRGVLFDDYKKLIERARRTPEAA